jgi:hypothetical protein
MAAADSSFCVFIGDKAIALSDVASFSINGTLLEDRAILTIVYQMLDSPKRDLRETQARPSIWAPFGWAAILTSILAVAIFLLTTCTVCPPMSVSLSSAFYFCRPRSFSVCWEEAMATFWYG